MVVRTVVSIRGCAQPAGANLILARFGLSRCVLFLRSELDQLLRKFQLARPPKTALRSQTPKTMAKKVGAMADLAVKDAPSLLALLPPDQKHNLRMTSPQVRLAVWVRASHRLARSAPRRAKMSRRGFCRSHRRGRFRSFRPLRSSPRATAVHTRHGDGLSSHARRLPPSFWRAFGQFVPCSKRRRAS